MTSKGSSGVLLTVACASVIGAAAVLHARETHAALPSSAERLMYLRSGRAAERVFLSFKSLAADVYWIRTIQHYGRDRKSQRTADRFALLQPLLDLTTTLDPHFNIAYRFGAIFLSTPAPDGPARPDQAIALLRKGLEQNGRRWQYAHDIGFIHYWYTGDFKEAAQWFAQAADMPNAPDWIRPLAATTLAQGGDRDGAKRMVAELMTAEEPYIRQAATRLAAQLQTLDAIDLLNVLVQRYREAAGHDPNGWDDLIRAGMLPSLPVDPTGRAFQYDSATHLASIDPASSLSPLPRGFTRR